MPIKQAVLALTAAAAWAGGAAAQTPSNDPLSAIGWLEQPQPRTGLPGTVLMEPPVTESAAQPPVTVAPLETLLPPTGLVPSSATGLPVDLWRGSDAATVARLLKEVPVRDSPAMQSLLFTLLLSETRPPAGSGDLVLLARLDRLMQLGAPDPAQALVQHAGPTATQARFARWFDATLLTGDEDRACAALTAAPHLSADYAARIFCASRRGDWTTAALMLESAHALALMPEAELDLLDRFLNPDMFEGAPPPPRPEDPDPLTFRLYEAIGERLPAAPLPRAFSAADLRDVAGWKAQLEAAERLTRIGALNPNQLLGLYSEREPAASGGVWDRVAAVQRFEAALSGNSADAVAAALRPAWEAAQEARIETAFADLFAGDLARFSLPGEEAALAWRIRLLAPAYETASHTAPDGGRLNEFLARLAQGRPDPEQAPSPLAEAIAQGFAADAAVPARLQALLRQGRLGETILQAMHMFARGAEGNLASLTGALATFRAVGLEDTARRGALQLMLLERN
ncbi:hypothetical protein ACUXV3_03715 [Roseobacteraceae bacterium NS-SX3]